MNWIIRNVISGDEKELAYIQTESWKEAFKHILSEELLKTYTDKNRSMKMYKRLIDEGIGHGYILEVNGNPHCIAWWDKARDEDMFGYAELICIHSLCNQWRKGYGTKLMRKILEDMKAKGYDKVLLWVFRDNYQARMFYEKLGFCTFGKMKTYLNTEEICYEKKLTL